MIRHQYFKAFIIAILIHIVLICGLMLKPQHKKYALNENMPKMVNNAQQDNIKPEPIKAISVDKQLVEQTVNQLKNERLAQEKKERARQNDLKRQAEVARKNRILEQEKLNKLKNENKRLQQERQKQITAEKKRIQELAKLKNEQEQKINELKKRQQQEAKNLQELNKKKLEEQAKQKEAARLEALRLKELQEKELAKLQAQKQERIKGEVNKYKSLIISAISRQWILPENADSSLSSQFRIELAPNGSVLNVELIKTSGDPILDRSAKSAIYKASPLPVPIDEDAFKVFKKISLTVRPQNARG